MENKLLKLLKFIFMTISLTVFTLKFGVPSYNSFSERRTIMSSRKVKYDLDNPPAISIILDKDSNKHRIEDCIRDSKENYQDTVDCIDRKFDIKELLAPDQEIPLGCH